MQWIYNYFIQPVSHSYGQYCVGGSLWCQIPYNDSTLSLSLTHEYSRKAQRCNREGEWCNATKGLQFTSLDLHALFPPSLDLIKSDILLPFFPLSLSNQVVLWCANIMRTSHHCQTQRRAGRMEPWQPSVLCGTLLWELLQSAEFPWVWAHHWVWIFFRGAMVQQRGRVMQWYKCTKVHIPRFACFVSSFLDLKKSDILLPFPQTKMLLWWWCANNRHTSHPCQ